MAARKFNGTKDNPWSEEHKARIRVSMLLERLQKHALGEVDMTQTQVRATEVLLKKVVPDLSAVEVSGEQEVRHTIMPTIPSPEEWEAEHAGETGH